jgi:hypothetical protein
MSKFDAWSQSDLNVHNVPDGIIVEQYDTLSNGKNGMTTMWQRQGDDFYVLERWTAGNGWQVLPTSNFHAGGALSNDGRFWKCVNHGVGEIEWDRRKEVT